MNKLVLKNPVQRFKQGKKIQFVKPGDKMLYHGNEEVIEDVLNGQTIYRRKDGSYVYPSNKFLSPTNNTPKTENLRKYYTYLPSNQSFYYSSPNGAIYTKQPFIVGKRAAIYTPSRGYYASSMFKYKKYPDIVNRLQKTNQVEKNQIENSENPSLQRYKERRWSEMIDRLWKKKLKEYIQSGAGVGKVDGKPKTNTNNPSNKEQSQQQKTNVSQTQKTPQTEQTQSAPTIGFKQAFRQARQAGLKEFTWNGKRFNTKTKDDVLKEKVKFIPPSITDDGGPVYDRSNDIPYMILKQGGQLVSRNPIY